jgi:protein FAM50
MDVLLELTFSQHYEFYHFMANRTKGFNGYLFPHSPQTTAHDPLSIPGKKKEVVSKFTDEELEGFNEDPAITKVVDRRWYERNKHIFPASLWEDFDPTKDYSVAVRKDTQGNAYFLGR